MQSARSLGMGAGAWGMGDLGENSVKTSPFMDFNMGMSARSSFDPRSDGHHGFFM